MREAIRPRPSQYSAEARACFRFCAARRAARRGALDTLSPSSFFANPAEDKRSACNAESYKFALEDLLTSDLDKPPYNLPRDQFAPDPHKSSTLRHAQILYSTQQGTKDLPMVASGHTRSKGEPGWPAWFRVGVFIDVLGLEKHPAVDGPLLDLADFSLGADADADAALQRALLGRGARLVPLLQKRLRTPPQYLDYTELERGLMAANGVKALSMQERNAVLQQVLSGLTAPGAKLPQRNVAKAK
jgi:hypothetical protein